MSGQVLCLVVAGLLFVVGAIMAGMQRTMVQVLGLAGLAFLTLAFLVPHITG
jgi:hypothetical protein